MIMDYHMGNREGGVQDNKCLKGDGSYARRFGICNNKQSYQQVNRSGEVMTQMKDIRMLMEMGHGNFCQAASMMEDEQDHYNDPYNSHSISPYKNAILHPTSIFQSTTRVPRLDHYLKIKSMDKPKDTLENIHAKKQAFISYVNPLSQHHQQTNSHPLQNHTQLPTRIKQQFRQFTFYKNCKTNTLLFARITHSRIHKCNISIANFRGQVLKYYPNVILAKKVGKILNFIAKNKELFLFVFDYTQTIDTVTKFPSILNDADLLYYKLININNLDQAIFTEVKEKVETIHKGQLLHLNSNIILKSKQICLQSMLDIVQLACQRINIIQAKQNTFLIKTRGKKQQTERHFPFDMMMVNIWKQYKMTNATSLINKIKSLFVLKQNTVSYMNIKQAQILHAPLKVPQEQNCCFCLSTDPQIKRPKRTHTICQRCSAQQEKPIYLCKDCFNLYHTQDDLYQFRKNQKKNKKKIKMVARQLGRKYAKKNFQNQFDHNQVQERPTENQMTLIRLDKKCDEFFEKIEQLIEERSLASTQYYLTMLMNMTILQTHKYTTKFCKKREEGIKMEND